MKVHVAENLIAQCNSLSRVAALENAPRTQRKDSTAFEPYHGSCRDKEDHVANYPDFTFEHLAINVPDRDAAERWYVENLNLRVVRSVPGAMSFLADASGRVVLELYANDSVARMDFSSLHYLTLHLAFAVHDIRAAAADLTAAGAAVVDDYRVAGDDELMMLRDPFGVYIQLVHRKQPMV